MYRTIRMIHRYDTIHTIRIYISNDSYDIKLFYTILYISYDTIHIVRYVLQIVQY